MQRYLAGIVAATVLVILGALSIAADANARARIAPAGHTTFFSADGSSVAHEQGAAYGSRMPEPTMPIAVSHFDPTAADSPCGFGDACSQYAHVWFANTPGGRQKHSILHELGHQVDYYVLDELARDEFQLVLQDNRDWLAFPNSPHEQFAEAYSVCATYGYSSPPDTMFGIDNIWMGYGLQMTHAQYRRICSSIRRAGIRRGLGAR